MRSWLPRPVWLLGGISLLTDTASEAIYPLLPIFLTEALGARPLAIGVIEGVAEATSSVLKVGSGWLSDRLGRRRALVRFGYGVSTLLRPLIGLTATWVQVLAIRFGDRVGKGIRGAPRDGMLAALSPPDIRGRVFGAHRAMDHLGAVVGPLLAAAFLWLAPGAYRALFLATIVPGVGVLLLLARLPADEGSGVGSEPSRIASRSSARLPSSYWRFMAVLLLFTLGNSADAYLLLRLSSLGVATSLIPLLWALLHVVKASSSVGGGLLADRLGRRPLIVAGWLVYAAVYAGFAWFDSAAATIPLFLVYGLYFGLTEGAEKALIADLAPASVRATAFGIYQAALGFGSLAASLVFGLCWEALGAPAAFGLGAALALAAATLLPLVVPSPHGARSAP